MQAIVHAARSAGLATHHLAPGAARPLIHALGDVLQALEQRQQRRGHATHGVGDRPPGGAGGVVRFYKQVSVREALDQGGYQIMLDQRLLKTPARRPLVLPSAALAMAVAAEWEQQAERIQPFTMPLMSLAATAIDQPKPREAVVESMLQYLPTDSVLCREERAGKLAERQAQIYDPVVMWAQQEMGVALRTTHSIFGSEVSPDDVTAVRRYLLSLDKWQLAAAEQLAASCKSVLIGLAALRGWLGVEAALEAARLEEDHQIGEWGLVEGGHDIDIADLRVRVAAPSLFVRLLCTH